ncbi:uncharacterized protein LOC128683024 [Plodia interpunctella]|uniref:uncharacterized protein LOC128683024 n=1 Tax=Plodia interpunctella TaxID=58824 RepID=UPI002368F209|nr:uncharacterized protein LOC128683024 [Plodia interpunctella]
MNKNVLAKTGSKPGDKKKKEAPKKLPPEFAITPSTSHTQYFRKDRYVDEFNRITTEEYLGYTESVSGSSDTFQCVHKQGKKYTAKGQLRRNLQKELDPAPADPKWIKECPPAFEWEMAETLVFLVNDPVVHKSYDRLLAHIADFSRTAAKGYKLHILDSLCTVVDFLVEMQVKKPKLRPALISLLKNMDKPILLNAASDVITYFERLRDYIGFLGYLLMRVEDDELFELVSKGILYQLSAPDSARGPGTVHVRHSLAAGAPVLVETSVRMLAVAWSSRFPTFLEIALLIALNDADICFEMIKENILENIFCRFNPYFPKRNLPCYDVSPDNPQDINVMLGDSTLNMTTTLSLLLLLAKTVKKLIEDNPKYRILLPCPDSYSQRCFIWAYRYECRAREHNHQRITLTIIVTVLLKCFGERLSQFSTLFMPDIMSLSVLTELPLRDDWTRVVIFNTRGQLQQADVHFKKLLIELSVECIKTFPYNKYMVEARHWFVGLMYLLDPGLCYLRAKWSQALFAEIRMIALQALVCTLTLAPHNLARDHGLYRRIMWYIEWYSESPYELSVLYWCMRLLQVATYTRDTPERERSIFDLFDTHGVIILIHLCYTLLAQKTPPVEKCQAIIALSLKMLASAVVYHQKVTCCVYPHIKWPASVHTIATKMLDVAIYSLERHYIICDRWLISLVNFVWEGIIWNTEYRQKFLANNGMYTLLDLITMVNAPVQCITLALVCDVARAGDAIGQMITWRANLGASDAHPCLVKRGATIATLLAAIFRDECRETGVPLSENGIIQDLENPIMSSDMKSAIKNHSIAGCMVAGDIAGSRMSKAFAILHLLSEDLESKVMLADEAYKLYKNVHLAPEDEAVLILCSHYLTLKLNEVWIENSQSVEPVAVDNEILREFLLIVQGWASKVKRQQEDVIEKDRKKEHEEEFSLYAFLARVRLNIALDALREVRCVARSADRQCIAHTLLFEAVNAHHRRSLSTKAMKNQILKTFWPKLDDSNMTGQYVKVFSIQRKDKIKPREDYPPS